MNTYAVSAICVLFTLCLCSHEKANEGNFFSLFHQSRVHYSSALHAHQIVSCELYASCMHENLSFAVNSDLLACCLCPTWYTLSRCWLVCSIKEHFTTYKITRRITKWEGTNLLLSNILPYFTLLWKGSPKVHCRSARWVHAQPTSDPQHKDHVMHNGCMQHPPGRQWQCSSTICCW